MEHIDIMMSVKLPIQVEWFSKTFIAISVLFTDGRVTMTSQYRVQFCTDTLTLTLPASSLTE